MRSRGSVQWKNDRCYIVVEASRGPDGKRRQHWHAVPVSKPGRRPTTREIDRFKVELFGRLDQGAYVAPKRQRLDGFVEQWLAAIQVAPATRVSYRRKLSHVVNRIGHLQLTDVDAGVLNGLYRQLAGVGLSDASIRVVHKVVHKLFRDAVRWGRLAVNPADRADPPKDRGRETPMVTWSASELRNFLHDSSGERYEPAWAVLALTGMRRGELLGLRWSDVDLDASRMTIQQARVMVGERPEKGPTKSGRARVISLDPDCVAALRRQRAQQASDRLLLGPGYSDQGYVFSHHDGRPHHPHVFSRQFTRRLDRYNRQHPGAELPGLSVHGLRHTWATLALRANVPAKVVSERLGHSSTVITLNVYSHVTPSMQTDAAEKVAGLVFHGSM